MMDDDDGRRRLDKHKLYKGELFRLDVLRLKLSVKKDG